MSGRVHRNAREESQSYTVRAARQGSYSSRTVIGGRQDGGAVVIGPARKLPARRGAVLDAVAVIAVLDPTNVHHDAAREALRALAGTPKLIHPINLAEVLVQPVKVDLVDETQAALKRAGIGTFTPASDEPLALARLRVNTGLKIPDVCAFWTAASRDLPLVTFDRRLTIVARSAEIEVLGAPPEWRQ